MSETATRPFDVIVFDLGGVLVELGGVTRMLELLSHRLSVEELWTRWLTSPSVRAFETGQCDAEAFAHALLAEFELAISPAQLLGVHGLAEGPLSRRPRAASAACAALYPGLSH